MTSKVPKVGDGATEYVGSDRYPYTVIDVSASGKTILIQSDETFVVKPAAYYGDYVTYGYKPNPNGSILTCTLRANGRYRVAKSSGTGVGWISVGDRRMYRDPSF